MNKRVIFNLVLLTILIPGVAFSARTREERAWDITKEYGPKLDQVSFKERFAFKKEMQKDWYESTLEERRDFLQSFHDMQVAQAARKEELRKQEAAEAKIKAREAKAEMIKVKQRKKKEELAAREYEQELANEKKESERKHEKIIKQMETLHKAERADRKDKI